MILHIDGDSFFASVETSLNPALRGKPVVTGHERGIATAMSKEAKALGISRGMPIFQVRKNHPQAIVVESDYHHYSIYAKRMYNIVRRYAPLVQEYSIDECFGDLAGLPDPVAAARLVKHDLQRELGMTFSLGLGPTKVIAKVASKWNKPDGFTVIYKEEIRDFLKDLAIGKIWGIGPATSVSLQRIGIKTALDLTERPLDWVRTHLDKREVALWHELRGETVFSIHDNDEPQASIQCTRTKTPPTSDKSILWSELSKNVEHASAKAREQQVVAKRIYYFLKTQEFRYHRQEIVLTEPLQAPHEILNTIKTTFDTTYQPHTLYRATGVTLSGLVPEATAQHDLFGEVQRKEGARSIYKIIDTLDRRFGAETIVLASSLRAFKRRGVRPGCNTRRFQIPFMGEVA